MFNFAFASSDTLVSINALEGSGFAYTLARPSLVALSGQSASFLAGGEVPIPVPSSGSDMPWLENHDGPSAATRELVDQEVRRIVDDCYADAMRVLRENRNKLDALARPRQHGRRGRAQRPCLRP